MKWDYEMDWERNPITKKIETIYRKFILEPTGRDIPYNDGGWDGDDHCQEFERVKSIRISKEEYENRGDNDKS